MIASDGRSARRCACDDQHGGPAQPPGRQRQPGGERHLGVEERDRRQAEDEEPADLPPSSAQPRCRRGEDPATAATPAVETKPSEVSGPRAVRSGRGRARARSRRGARAANTTTASTPAAAVVISMRQRRWYTVQHSPPPSTAAASTRVPMTTTSRIHCGTASSPRSRSDANPTRVSPNSHSTRSRTTTARGDDEAQDVGRGAGDRRTLATCWTPAAQGPRGVAVSVDQVGAPLPMSITPEPLAQQSRFRHAVGSILGAVVR